MVALKVEKIGDRMAVVLTDEALEALNVGPGDTVNIEAASGPPAAWIEDAHARGRAFLRRYNKTFARFEG